MENEKLCQKCSVLCFDDSLLDDGKSQSRSCLAVTPIQVWDQHRIERPDFKVEDQYPELPWLTGSAQSGCPFCHFLLRSIKADRTRLEIEAKVEEAERSDLTIVLEYLWTEDPRTKNLGLELLQISLKFEAHLLAIWCSVEALPSSPDVQEWLILKPNQGDHYLCEESLRWMRFKLADCVQHDHISRQKDALPTRLIDLTKETARLIDSSELFGSTRSSKPRFAALSYCWGSEEDVRTQLKTTKATITSRSAAIHNCEMTPVLIDAIKVTKALSLSYLWLDALCIIQDDQEDWERECAKMDGVFIDAHVTLCAVSSNSCQEGFLNRLVPAQRVRIPFESRVNPKIRGAYILRYMEPDGDPLSAPLPASYDLKTSRWAYRGWVFQEKTLATRLLLFGASDVHFVCSSSSDSWSRASRLYKEPYLTTVRGLTGTESAIEGPSRRPYYLWAEVVEAFTRASSESGRLTIATDVLPALSGLANYVQHFVQDRYIAGMWERDLYRSLVWYISDPWEEKTGFSGNSSIKKRWHFDEWFRRLKSQNPYIGPSWSWIRCDNVFMNVHGQQRSGYQTWYDVKSEYQYIHVETVLKDKSNPFGAVQNGRLKITSKILALNALSQEAQSGAWSLGSSATIIPDWRGWPSVGPEDRQDLALVLIGSYVSRPGAFSNTDPSSDEDVDNPTDQEEDTTLDKDGGGFSDEEADASLIKDDNDSIDRKEEHDQPDTGRGAYGLLLYPAAENNTYYRVGMFCSYVDTSGGMRLFRDCEHRSIEII